ncbi:Photosystem I chlorophyll a/b-binding protein 5, chloroplastic [Trebouxia sp. C0009 RCD-2024]
MISWIDANCNTRITCTQQVFLRPKPQAPLKKRATEARRTVRQGASKKSGPNWVLDEPKRLWEIGSRYWLPFNNFEPPEYLDGSLPGDRGFDPLRLGATWGNPPDESDSSQSRIGWLLEGELYNGRVAMLAVVGILTVEALGRGPWWQAYNSSSWPAAQYAAAVVTVHLAFALLEKQRLENFEERGEAGHFGQAVFDPAGLTDDYTRQAEVRNARLGMLAALGFAVQAWVTGKGPIQNAIDHLRDPFGQNVFTQGERGLQVTGAFLVFAVGLHLIEAARNSGQKKGSTSRTTSNTSSSLA